MQIFGAVSVAGVEYDNDEIGTINPNQPLEFGVNWDFLGDQGFEESNIYVVNGNSEVCFDGKYALNDFLRYFHTQKLADELTS
jgi:hypothetical protein